MKLTARLTLVFLFAMVVLAAAFGFLAVRTETLHFEREQQEHARQIVAQVEEPFVMAWRERNSEQAIQIVRDSTAHQQILQVRWVWFDATVDSKERPAVAPNLLIGMPQGNMMSFQARDNTGAGHLHTYYPINLGNGRQGALEFTGSLSKLDDQTRGRIYRTLGLIGAMVLVCGGLVVLVGLRMVGQPLERLIEKTRRVGAGDFSEPLQLDRHDELGQLAAALNEMCDKLVEQQRRIHTEAAARVSTLEQLRHADRLKTVGRLAAGIAHEMGTPLNVISGRAGLIAANKLSAGEVHQSAVAIKSESDKITTIIRQLLNFAHRGTPHRTQADLVKVVQQTATLLETLAEKRGVSVQIKTPDETAIDALIDVGQMQQVLTNLIVNGIQAMPDGGIVTIRFDRRQAMPPDGTESSPREFVCIEIEDHGMGIAAEALEQIFEPFFTTKEVGEGTGLGLSIAYGIIREHGGWIDVASELGRGSCFTIYLPPQDSEPTRL